MQYRPAQQKNEMLSWTRIALIPVNYNSGRIMGHSAYTLCATGP
jgi:hypothetical protein